MARRKKSKKRQPVPKVQLSNTRGVQTTVYVNTAQPPRRKKRSKVPLPNMNYIFGQKRYLLNPNNRYNATIDPYVTGHYQSIIHAKLGQDISYVKKKLEQASKPKTFRRQRRGRAEFEQEVVRMSQALSSEGELDILPSGSGSGSGNEGYYSYTDDYTRAQEQERVPEPEPASGQQSGSNTASGAGAQDEAQAPRTKTKRRSRSGTRQGQRVRRRASLF